MTYELETQRSQTLIYDMVTKHGFTIEDVRFLPNSGRTIFLKNDLKRTPLGIISDPEIDEDGDVSLKLTRIWKNSFGEKCIRTYYEYFWAGKVENLSRWCKGQINEWSLLKNLLEHNKDLLEEQLFFSPSKRGGHYQCHTADGEENSGDYANFFQNFIENIGYERLINTINHFSV